MGKGYLTYVHTTAGMLLCYLNSGAMLLLGVAAVDEWMNSSLAPDPGSAAPPGASEDEL